MRASTVYDKLVQYEIKPSVQRIAVMEYLATHFTHPTVEEIYLALSPKYPTLSRTTVYNTLKLFVEHGAAQMLTIDEKVTCFDGNVTPHAHFQCKRCGAIQDVPAVPLRAADYSMLEQEGVKVTEVHQYLKGLCKQCLISE